jgi:phage recombination protein Bet
MENSVSITKAARTHFAPEQVRLMKDTVAKDCSDAEFHFFLEVCARYEFNPFLGEIYAAKMPSRTGGGGRVAIIVGKYGWIKEANRHPTYDGMDGDVVRENDVFRVVRGADGRRTIHHEVEMGKDKPRGPIVGAWAEIELTNRKPVYFYAPLEEYLPTSQAKLDYSPWGKQVSAMILKCAQVSALRLAFHIGGVYDEAELAHAFAQSGQAGPPPMEPDWGEDPETAQRLQNLVACANEVEPGSFMPEKVRLKLDGAGAAEREAFAEEVAAFIVAKGGTLPDEMIPEAEVVPG